MTQTVTHITYKRMSLENLDIAHNKRVNFELKESVIYINPNKNIINTIEIITQIRVNEQNLYLRYIGFLVLDNSNCRTPHSIMKHKPSF